MNARHTTELLCQLADAPFDAPRRSFTYLLSELAPAADVT